MNHNTSRILMYVSWAIGILPTSFGVALKWWWLAAIAGSILIAGMIQAFIFCRCPCCGGNIMKKVLGQEYCPYCGEPLD